nr:bis(5'-nucleosyl)-tetraphosphatase (symmetrical) [uncultured bacterium]
MATYAIGDVQGCFIALCQLLKQINFDPQQDHLWFTGDLVNRGPDSLSVLRFVKSLGTGHYTVLGNHDLHLLAVAYGVRSSNQEDTFHDVLQANDRDELIEWLMHRPLLVHDAETQYVMTHAGLAPMWSVTEAIQLAKEVEYALQGAQRDDFLSHLYGNEPSLWHPDLIGYERLRCITNYLTRMRFCDENGRLQLNYKGDIEHKPPHHIPWFEVNHRANTDINIIFGHWAALNGKTRIPRLYPLDTGCVWGRCLTAMRLSDRQYFSMDCQNL